ncbi:similar to Saccharomyces cerevisiae YMR253C Putative protein of unknown function [Maudiozyma saulgeensis]|uniref:EamA domain-containing protein n=1 Tax=Maudiozyma saulgeensis TaxID=1789683 RepID=A0A1X7R8T9_9SACH|nr:similar to Saccharomyces cerevisiae YMR253C Putative protein of unknown function [Kazachstania saulgeensis]
MTRTTMSSETPTPKPSTVSIKEEYHVQTRSLNSPFESSSDPDFTIDNHPLRIQDSFIEKYVKPNTGIILLIIAQFFNSLMVVSTKILETNPDAETHIKPLQILLVRMLITWVGTLIYMQCNKDTVKYAPFGDPAVRKYLVLRGSCGFFGVFGMYFALMYLSISDAVLITFLSPTLTILLAWVVLREKINRWEVLGSIVSFIGVVLIIRPPFLFGTNINGSSDGSSVVETSNPKERLIATMVALWGALCGSAVYIIIRFIGKRAHAIINVSYFSLTTLIISTVGVVFIPSMHFQIPHSKLEWLLFTNLGICGFIFQLMLTLGIQKERAGRGSLVGYTQLIYSIFWDVSLYHHWPPIWSWAGMVIIIGSTIFVLKFKSPSDDDGDCDLSTSAAKDPESLQSPDEGLEMDDFNIDDSTDETGN